MRVGRLILAFLVITTVATAQKRVAVVLTGGGARGLAQVGILKQLIDAGITPDVVVGSSFGAIVGGLYASGYSPTHIDSVFRVVDWSALTELSDDTDRETLFFAQKAEDDRSIVTFRFRDFTFLPPTAIGGSARFASQLQELLWRSPYNYQTNFDSLHCKFRAVATDLVAGSWVALDRGNLATALQASAMFPLRYAPIMVGKRVLVDGGLVANIPVPAAEELGCDFIIVINTVGELMPRHKLQDAIDVADQSLSVAMKQLDSTYLARADAVIRPDVSDVSTFDFQRAAEILDRGTVPDSVIKSIYENVFDIKGYKSAIATPFDSVAVEYLDGRPLENLDASSLLSVTRLWYPEVKQKFTTAVLRLLRQHGYNFEFVRNINYRPKGRTMVVTVDDAKLRNIVIDSSRPIRMSDVLPEISLTDGEPLTNSDLTSTTENLRASDLFDDVALTLVPHADSGMNVLVGATDRGNQAIRLGARIDNERFTQVAVDLIQQNIFQSTVRLDVGGNISQRIGMANLKFEMPRIVNTLWTATLRGYASFRNVWIYNEVAGLPRDETERERVGEFSEDRLGATFSLGRQLERNGVILAELRYEQQRYRDLNATTTPGYQPLTTARFAARWDDRDRVDFARTGRVIDLFAETSLLNLSNGLSFTKLSARIETALPVGDFVITPSFFIGAADRTLPGPELFSLGGQDQFFGMREDEERGRQLVVGNLAGVYKLPFTVVFDTYVGVRYDVGAVWAEPEKIRVAELRHAFGATVGFDTPIGPARFSLGRRFYFTDDPDGVVLGPFLGYFGIGVRL